MTSWTRRVFREPWNEADGNGGLDETWPPDVVVGGMATESDRLGLAHAYAEAAAMLVDAAQASREPWRVCYPIFYLYRHALELYLKDALSQHRRGHDLALLIREFDESLREESRGAMPARVRDDLLTLAAMDPDGQTFRHRHQQRAGAGNAPRRVLGGTS